MPREKPDIMSTTTTGKLTATAALDGQMKEAAIRDYAFYLYEKGGHVHGPNADFWREAEECIGRNLAFDHGGDVRTGAVDVAGRSCRPSQRPSRHRPSPAARR